VYLNEVYDGELLTMADGNLYLKRNIKALEQMFENLEDKELLEFVLTCMDAIKGEDNTYKDFVQTIKDKNFISYKALAWYVAKISKYKVDLKSTRTGQLDCVSLVTTHSSKGKEWKYVFASLTDFKTDIAWDEETNRLLYVLVTRAKDYLDITVGKPSKGINPYYNKFLEISEITGKVKCV
jgi:superfamily I DNA/RNA helicase